MIGCPYPLLHHVNSCDLLLCPFSGHSAVLLKCPTPEPLPRGPGRWKLNTSILANGDFITLISEFWTSWCLVKDSFNSLQAWWDCGKERIKSITISFCSQLARESSQSRSLLFNLANHLKSTIDLGQVSLRTLSLSLVSLALQI